MAGCMADVDEKCLEEAARKICAEQGALYEGYAVPDMDARCLTKEREYVKTFELTSEEEAACALPKNET